MEGLPGGGAHRLIHPKVESEAGKLILQIRTAFEVETPAGQPGATERKAKQMAGKVAFAGSAWATDKEDAMRGGGGKQPREGFAHRFAVCRLPI